MLFVGLFLLVAWLVPELYSINFHDESIDA